MLSIKELGERAQDRFNDKEFGRFYSQTVSQRADKALLLMDLFIDYTRAATPLLKTDTVHTLIEEALKRKQGRLEQKKIELFKQFEKDLPETTLPDERLKFVLDAVLEYAAFSVPPGGRIGVTTKTLYSSEHRPMDQIFPLKGEKSIEISLILSDFKMAKEEIGTELGISSFPSEGLQGLELRLVEQVVRKNRGQVAFRVDKALGKAFISIRLPAERRKVFYYEPANASRP